MQTSHPLKQLSIAVLLAFSLLSAACHSQPAFVVEEAFEGSAKDIVDDGEPREPASESPELIVNLSALPSDENTSPGGLGRGGRCVAKDHNYNGIIPCCSGLVAVTQGNKRTCSTAPQCTANQVFNRLRQACESVRRETVIPDRPTETVTPRVVQCNPGFYWNTQDHTCQAVIVMSPVEDDSISSAEIMAIIKEVIL